MTFSTLTTSQIMSGLHGSPNFYHMQCTPSLWTRNSTSSQGQKRTWRTNQYHHVEKSCKQRVIWIPNVCLTCRTTSRLVFQKEIRIVNFEDDFGFDVKVPVLKIASKQDVRLTFCCSNVQLARQNNVNSAEDLTARQAAVAGDRVQNDLSGT